MQLGNKACPSTFKLVPPADIRYKYSREKPTGEDYVKRIYECEDEQHRNTIYWEPEGQIFFTPITSTNDHDRYSDLY